MKAKMISKIILSFWILLFLFLFGGLNLKVAQAETYTVTKTTDTDDGACDADCSLREAIVAANANAGHDVIQFAIQAAGVQTIRPEPTELNPITDPVTIDGYTQCFSPNPCAEVATATSPARILIEINGEKTTGNGLTLGNGSSGSTIRGLSINRFTRAGGGTGHAIGIVVPPSSSDSGSNWIAGNYLNVAPDGHTIFPGPWGAGLNDSGIGHNIIGHDPLGPNSANPAADRNVISGAGTAGVFNGLQIFAPSEANAIRGNYIGTDDSGTQVLGNPGLGIRLVTGKHLIEGNLISGNGSVGIGIFVDNIFGLPPADNNMIRGNKIGTDVTGMVDLGNSQWGIRLGTGNNTIEDNLISGNNNHGIFSQNNSGNNLIKGNKIGTDVTGTLPLGNIGPPGVPASGVAFGFSSNNRIESNVIAFNGSNGVGVANSVSNTILSNSIFSNSHLGIDLLLPPPPAGVGIVNLNDPLDTDEGPNNLQNFPVIDGKRSFLNPALVEVWGSLDSKPSRDYRIQVFSSVLADPSGHGEGQVLVGETIVTTDPSGRVDFHFPAKLNALSGTIISATATDLLTNDTSEFSAWVNVDEKGSPTAYEHAASAAGGDGSGGISWEEQEAEQPLMEEEPTEE